MTSSVPSSPSAKRQKLNDGKVGNGSTTKPTTAINGASDDGSTKPPKSILHCAQQARRASQKVSALSNEEKNKCLDRIQNVLRDNKERIMAENKLDVDEAIQEFYADCIKKDPSLVGESDRSKFPSLPPLINRLSLKNFDSLCDSINQVKNLDDPVGKCLYANEIENHKEHGPLNLFKVSCPIGVLGIIYEARPEAGVQITCLAIKSGNCLLLKGGKEARRTNKILVELMNDAIIGKVGRKVFIIETPYPKEGVLTLVEAREEVSEMLKMDKYIDLLIPRGGNSLVQYIKRNTMIPVLGHADGICAAYIDAYIIDEIEGKNQNMDQMENGKIEWEKKVGRIIHESKTNYTSACNSIETLLIHSNHFVGKGGASSTVVPMILSEFCEGIMKSKENNYKTGKIQFRCCPKSLESMQEEIKKIAERFSTKGGEFESNNAKVELIKQNITAIAATAADYDTEFLDLILAVKVVDNIDEAIDHINLHGSKHTDLILSQNPENIEKFMQCCDSADVFANMSTRFADGFRFGFGAEVGISTNRIHSRGPVGLEGLVIYKYRGYGNGHSITDCTFTHNKRTDVKDVQQIKKIVQKK